MVHLQQGEKDSFDWPLADVAVVLDIAAGRTLQERQRSSSARPRRCRTGPSPPKRSLRANALMKTWRRKRAGPHWRVPRRLAKNAYKLPLFETLVRRAILAAAATG